MLRYVSIIWLFFNETPIFERCAVLVVDLRIDTMKTHVKKRSHYVFMFY